jgi:hypothetical protein
MSTSAPEPVPGRCERCGTELERGTTACPKCGIRLGLSWPAVFTGVALLGIGTAVALQQRALDWFLFLGGCFVAASIASWVGWSQARSERDPGQPESQADGNRT